MATIAPVNLGTAANDGTGDDIRAGGSKLNANDLAINTELIALLTAVGIASGDVNMETSGVFTGTTISAGATTKVALQDLESALETINALSAGYAVNSSGVPVAADTLETAIAKLHFLLEQREDSLRPAGGFDATVGTFPNVAGAGVAVAGNTVEAGYVFTVSVAGTVGGENFFVGDQLEALIDGPSTTVLAGNWLHRRNKADSAYAATALNDTLAFEGRYVQGDHNVGLPKITTENDGQPIEVAGVAAWGTAGMTSAAWTPAAGDTVEAVTLPANSVDIVTLIPVFATLTWLVRVGGAPIPEQEVTYATYAAMVAVDPATLTGGRQVSVSNDPTPNLNGTYIVTGVPGAAGTGYIK